jgi:hypothetical protein
MFDDAISDIRLLEKELLVPEGFFLKLADEDDWSFVIKCHSLLEAAVARALLDVVGDNRLEDVFASLTFANRKTGKLAFVESLELLPKHGLMFVSRFAELRNSLVHRLNNVQFDLGAYVKSLDEQRFAAFFEWVTLGQSTGDGAGSEKAREKVRHSPKSFLFIGLMFILAFLYNRKERLRLSRETENLAAKFGKRMMDQVKRVESDKE